MFPKLVNSRHKDGLSIYAATRSLATLFA